MIKYDYRVPIFIFRKWRFESDLYYVDLSNIVQTIGIILQIVRYIVVSFQPTV